MTIDLSWGEGIILIIGGFFAGCINTLAGYGSIISLTLMMDVIGLPPNIANGSNRINVLSTGLIGTYIFHKNGKIDFAKGKWFLLITFIGAMAGVYIATIISNEEFKGVFKYLVFILFILLLAKPKRWLRKHSEDYQPKHWIVIPAFLLIGFYGGFIQMGVGLFMLAILVLGARYNLIEANAMKIALTAFYTVVVLLIFWLNNMIHWPAGIALAIGATAGGYFTSQFATKHHDAHKVAYRLLVVIIIIILLYQFNVFTW